MAQPGRLSPQRTPAVSCEGKTPAEQLAQKGRAGYAGVQDLQSKKKKQHGFYSTMEGSQHLLIKKFEEAAALGPLQPEVKL